MDLSDRESIKAMIARGQEYGEIKYMVNGAGVSSSQAPIEAILKVDLYGTAVLLEEVGKVIARGGAGVTISSQSGWRMPQLTTEQDRALATTPTEELLSLEILQPENIKDTLHAYQMAKRCNEKRVMYEAVRWGERGARLNDIAPGIIVTPLAVDEFNGPRGDFYKNMFAKCPAGRPGTEDALAVMKEHGIAPQAWGPLAEGKHGIFTDPELTAIVEKYGKSTAQVVLRWNTQRGISILPKSTHVERMEQNINIWDFELTEDEMKKIGEKDLGHSEIINHFDPQLVKMLNNMNIH